MPLRSVRWSLLAPVFALFACPMDVAWAQTGTGVPKRTPAPAQLQVPSRPVAAASGARRPKRRMRIGFYVTAVRAVDWTAESFLVDFYWWIRYPKPASEGDRKLAARPCDTAPARTSLNSAGNSGSRDGHS